MSMAPERAGGLPILGAILLCALSCRGAATNAPPEAAGALWFPVGESMEYRLYWGVIPVGTAKLWTEWVEKDGRRCVALKGEAESNGVLKHIFPVHDEVTSIVDPATFLPLLYEQKLREGRHFRHDRFVFDHVRCKAGWTSVATSKRREIDIDMETRDVLSFTYFMRKSGFEEGKTELFRVVVDEKVYDLELSGLVSEQVRLDDFGKVGALKIEPRAKFGGVFTRGGRVLLWVSDDPRHICVRMVGLLPVATAKGILTSLKGPGSSEWPRPRGGAK